MVGVLEGGGKCKLGKKKGQDMQEPMVVRGEKGNMEKAVRT
jgi:hypothetical protein